MSEVGVALTVDGRLLLREGSGETVRNEDPKGQENPESKKGSLLQWTEGFHTYVSCRVFCHFSSFNDKIQSGYSFTVNHRFIPRRNV